jgi:hypothetical protein
MTPIERIIELLRLADSRNRLFPATIVYNEGWFSRLVLGCISRQHLEKHLLNFDSYSRWFSETLLPSQFLARKRPDHLAEGWTHANGVIGHIIIGNGAQANTTLSENASQFIVTEAKIFSPLSRGVTHAPYFDQAARSIACMAEVLFRANRPPERFSSLGFIVLAPREQIDAHLFSRELSIYSIERKVRRRVSEYPAGEKKEEWLSKWFLPTLGAMTIDCISWEEVIATIAAHDKANCPGLSEFYLACLNFNRPQEPDVNGATQPLSEATTL